MPLKIRLARHGSKKRPFYRIVVAKSTAPRNGAFVEKVGTYNPILPKDSAERVTLDAERVKYWLSCGAAPTEAVERFLVKDGIIKLTDKQIKLREKRDLLLAKRREEEAKKKQEESEAA